jgi:aspartate/tyrosine/aromatic aminotransferase
LFAGADVDEALSQMQSIWVPNDTWEAFIVRVMSEEGVDYPPL